MRIERRFGLDGLVHILVKASPGRRIFVFPLLRIMASHSPVIPVVSGKEVPYHRQAGGSQDHPHQEGCPNAAALSPCRILHGGDQLVSLDGQTRVMSHLGIQSPFRVGKYGMDVEGFEQFLLLFLSRRPARS